MKFSEYFDAYTSKAYIKQSYSADKIISSDNDLSIEKSVEYNPFDELAQIELDKINAVKAAEQALKDAESAAAQAKIDAKKAIVQAMADAARKAAEDECAATINDSLTNGGYDNQQNTVLQLTAVKIDGKTYDSGSEFDKPVIIPVSATLGMAQSGAAGEVCVLPYTGVNERSYISRRHAQIRFDSGCWRITDISSNGTSLNGIRLVKNSPYKLKSGDTVMLDKAVEFKVSLVASGNRCSNCGAESSGEECCSECGMLFKL